MNPTTLDVKEFDSQETAEAAGYTVPLSKRQASELSPMNREQRRAWLHAQRKSGKLQKKKDK